MVPITLPKRIASGPAVVTNAAYFASGSGPHNNSANNRH
jgi:hypothetical protein